MAALAAAVEATVSLLAFSRVLSSLDSAVQIVAYAIGVGGGTLVGLAVNDRLNQPTPVTAGAANHRETMAQTHRPAVPRRGTTIAGGARRHGARPRCPASRDRRG